MDTTTKETLKSKVQAMLKKVKTHVDANALTYLVAAGAVTGVAVVYNQHKRTSEYTLYLAEVIDDRHVAVREYFHYIDQIISELAEHGLKSVILEKK